MALIDDKVEEIRNTASTRRGAYASRVEDVQADRTLSLEGKRLAIKELADSTAKELDELRKRELAVVSEEFERRERKVFGSPPTDSAGLIAFRDAQERAGQIGSQDHDRARNSLKQAKLSDDKQLAGAILARAFVFGWTDLVDEYRATYPDRAADLDELSALNRFLNDSNAKFVRGMVYSPPSQY